MVFEAFGEFVGVEKGYDVLSVTVTFSAGSEPRFVR